MTMYNEPTRGQPSKDVSERFKSAPNEPTDRTQHERGKDNMRAAI